MKNETFDETTERYINRGESPAVTAPRTTFPKLVVGRTYRYTFTGTDDATNRQIGTWAVRDSFGWTAAAFRAYVMRWTRKGRYTAQIEEVI